LNLSGLFLRKPILHVDDTSLLVERKVRELVTNWLNLILLVS
jgi:hypothetical protein